MFETIKKKKKEKKKKKKRKKKWWTCICIFYAEDLFPSPSLSHFGCSQNLLAAAKDNGRSF